MLEMQNCTVSADIDQISNRQKLPVLTLIKKSKKQNQLLEERNLSSSSGCQSRNRRSRAVKPSHEESKDVNCHS